MAKKAAKDDRQQFRGTGSEAVEAAQAQRAGSKFEWHMGRITRLGTYATDDVPRAAAKDPGHAPTQVVTPDGP